MNITDISVKEYHCIFCNKSFNGKKPLKQHTKDKHEKQTQTNKVVIPDSNDHFADSEDYEDIAESSSCKEPHEKQTQTARIIIYTPSDHSNDSEEYDDSEDITECSICKETHEWIFRCDGCDLDYCNDCSKENEDEQECNVNDCWYCSHGTCFNNLTLYRYCDECCPQDVLDENMLREQKYQEAEEYYNKVQREKPIRKKELLKALHEAGLELRSDSKLCKKYLDHAIGDIDEIVERMCQMKFLYDYNDMKNVLDTVAKDFNETLEAGYIPDYDVFGYSEYIVLEKIGGEYPDVYPWQN